MTLRRVRELAEALHAADVQYCHWKGSVALSKVAAGEKDLDLLVAAADYGSFRAILGQLGFKEALFPTEGVAALHHHYAYDDESGRLVHVHAASQILIGNAIRGVHRLPVEKPLLLSAIAADPFKIPKPEFEYVVFVLRMVLARSFPGVPIPWARGPALAADRRLELEYLRSRVDIASVHEVLHKHLPQIGGPLFQACERALEPECSGWDRARTTWRLQGCVEAWPRRPRAVQLGVALWRRGDRGVRRRLGIWSPKSHLVRGGAMIALVGGDGSGKSTAIKAVSSWLGEEFATRRVHLGRPPWSWTTYVIRGALKVQRRLAQALGRGGGVSEPAWPPTSSSYDLLLRHVCRARDRYRHYRRARRYAARGDVVVVFCDRFPLAQPFSADGPKIESLLATQPDRGRFGRWLAAWLVRLELSWYEKIEEPDVIVVLKLPPDIAVERKPEENPERVWVRNREVWEANWAEIGARVIDATQPVEDVHAALRSIVWSFL